MNEKSDSNTNRVTAFIKEVAYARAVQWAGYILDFVVVAAIGLVAAIVVLILTGGTVPAWTLAGVMLLALGGIYSARRGPRIRATNLANQLETAESALDRHDSYGKNLCVVMDTYQRILAGDLKLSSKEFIERGLLDPARDVMRANGHAADVRLSVLLAKGDHFEMLAASGHRLESKQKYRVPIKDTLSKLVYETQVAESWDDVEKDKHFKRNPEATRDFRSLVSVPFRYGGTSAGVFNAITARVDAFDAADVNYLTSLGSVIEVAVAAALKETRRRPVTRAKPKAAVSRGKTTARKRAALTQPGRPVRSSRPARKKSSRPAKRKEGP